MAVTDLASTTAAVSAGYTIQQYTVTSQGQVTQVAKLTKWIPQPNSGYFEFFGSGISTLAVLTTAQLAAQTRALGALNAMRRHRYGGSPGGTSPMTQAADSHGDTHTPDVN